MTFGSSTHQSASQYQLALVPHSYQGALIQQRAVDGYINATAMCKASGKEWSGYRRLDSTDEFLDALGRSLQIHRDLIIQSIAVGLRPGLTRRAVLPPPPHSPSRYSPAFASASAL